MLSSATAARVSQADQKGWKEFHKEVQQSIKSLISPRSDANKPTRKQEQMAAFFNKLAKAKGRDQR